MSAEYSITGPGGSITVTPGALEQLVANAVESVDGARVHRRRRRLEIAIEDGEARVGLELGVRYGLVLPEVARVAQERVVDALERMCGLEVTAVDVSVEELDE